MRLLGVVALALAFTSPMALAQSAAETEAEAAPSRAETGGATTLEDILRRQRGEEVDMDFRRENTGSRDGAASIADPLGTLGGASDPELWRALRFGTADVTSQVRAPGATLLVQDSGMSWLEFREGPLRTYGGYFLLGVIGLLALFFLIRGRIRIGAGRSAATILRFKAIERFGHWLLAGSFILLGLTGLFTLYARLAIGRPETGLSDEASIMARQDGAWLETALLGAKWIHNNVSWAFMLALVLVFVMWVIHNLPDKTDIKWLLQGGGIFTKAHPPAKKFNAGQKLIFWSVIVLGASISASGLSLLFPFELPMFAKTFALLNGTGLPEAVGLGALPETLTPHAEMQLSQAWHAIVSFVLMGIIIAHIYIGSVGMEGAYDAMGSGEVDLNWAKEHHSLWVEEVQSKNPQKIDAPGGATPAE
ncbi:formate dehydrogenase subunit gamma [Alphaproteobacteria bacterium GH1-50]|uniref:Formate dehydrogenase subunit gamma n=2 Tax=Kangsaoukella pontilimi TaxID=2691042 RepID=A0A7C9IFT2_9RHOB|nr:formate dehydrogenase subunit gamma [Kangsaoukella pontilimi]